MDEGAVVTLRSPGPADGLALDAGRWLRWLSSVICWL
jgi:hypothetical protein